MLSNWFSNAFGVNSHDAVLENQILVASTIFSGHVSNFIYEYFLPQIKKPPDGIITGAIVPCLMLAVNTLLFLQGLWKIYKFVAKRKAEKRKVAASKPEPPLFGYFDCYLSLKLPNLIHDAFAGNAINSAFTIHYDTDSSKVIVDNAANCHICNDKSMFVSNITPIPATADLKVATAGGETAPVGYGDVL